MRFIRFGSKAAEEKEEKRMTKGKNGAVNAELWSRIVATRGSEPLLPSAERETVRALAKLTKANEVSVRFLGGRKVEMTLWSADGAMVGQAWVEGEFRKLDDGRRYAIAELEAWR